MSGKQQLFWLILYTGLPVLLSSQTTLTDTVLQIRPVEIRANRLIGWDATGKVLGLDSLDRMGFVQGQLADLLGGISPVAIKQYGPAGIGTSSVRGGNAAQTQVLWNGFPINNPMLAQTDLSLIPLPLLDEISLHYGNGSALWGSGAIGGTIAMANKARFDPGITATSMLSWGCFAQQQQAIRTNIQTRKSVTQIRALRQSAANNFSYTDLFGESRTLENARTRQEGMVLGQFLRLGKHRVAAHAWWQEANREVPPTRVQQQSVAEQADAAWRLALDYKYLANRWTLNLRGARFRDRLQYRDSLLGLATDSRAITYWAEALAEYHPNAHHQLESGWQWHIQNGTSGSYRRDAHRRQVSWIGRYQWQPNNNWLVSLRLRQSWADGQPLPVIPYLGVQSRMSSWLTLRANLHRSYRLPGLDDLFWEPGGNPALQPEAGWGQELGLQASLMLGQVPMTYQLTGFSRQIDHWIQWVPGNAYWSPRNIKKVWSRGLEQELSVSLNEGPLQADLRLFYHLIRSTDESDAGQQLIYVPVHQGGGQLTLKKDLWTLQYAHRSSSRSFTVSDHSEYLDGWQRGDLHLSYDWSLGAWAGRLQFSVQNIWNTHYELVVNRPLPGRHIMGHLVFRWSQRPKK